MQERKTEISAFVRQTDIKQRLQEHLRFRIKGILERRPATPANLLAYKIIDESFDEFSKKHYETYAKL